MNESLTTEGLRRGIANVARGMEDRIDELNRLDGVVGDGDLGVTIARGLEGLRVISPDLPEDIGKALEDCAGAIIDVSGSTFGTVIAAFLMSIGKSTIGRTSVPLPELGTYMQSAVDDVKRRSGAQSGDKTAVDSLEVIGDRVGRVSTWKEAKAESVEACKRVLVEFRDRTCRQGRARIFGEKTQGKDDPGMLAIYYIIACI